MGSSEIQEKKTTEVERYRIPGGKPGKWHLIIIEDWLEGEAEINPSPPTHACSVRKDSWGILSGGEPASILPCSSLKSSFLGVLSNKYLLYAFKSACRVFLQTTKLTK